MLCFIIIVVVTGGIYIRKLRGPGCQLIRFVTLNIKHDILIWPLIDDNPNLSMHGNIDISRLQVLPKGRKLSTIGMHGDTNKTGTNFIYVSKLVFNMLVYVTRAETIKKD